MKTIVQGKTKFSPKEDKMFLCPDCGWLGVANSYEYKYANYSCGGFYYVFCPNCAALVPELEPWQDEYKSNYELVKQREREEE